MATRVTASRFVGRSAQLAELVAALRDAAAGRPSLAFIAGESGVGKSRLLHELETHAAAEDVRVLGGDCVELGEGELPYAPMVAMLRSLARAQNPVLLGLPDSVRSELATLVPALGAAPVAGDQARLFEALWTLFAALAEDRPLVLSLEDLHWADRSTRAFLSFLNATMCGDRILVVVTYRPDELHRRHPLRPLLAELERDHRARRIDLQPLDRDELAEQLADILGSEADAALVDRLWQRSEGNPLFTEELLAAGLDGRGGLPPSLRDALMLRIERLPDDAHELLRVLAIGQRLDHDTLAAVAGLDARPLRDALREAVANHILVAHEDGTYAFRHALLREVLHDDLLPGERAELHLALARALTASGGSGSHRAAAIAHHFLAGGDQPAALTASVRAGDAARRVHAYGESADLFERALELWDRVPDAEERTGGDLVTVLMRAAWGNFFSNRMQRAEALQRRALELVDEERNPRRAAWILERLHRSQWNLNRQNEAFASLERGLDLVADDPDAAGERSMLLAGKAKIRMLQSRYRESVEIGRRALAETSDDAVETRALNALGVSLMTLGEIDEGRSALERAQAIAERNDRPQDVCSASVNLADALHLWGRSDEALEVAGRGLRLATRMGRTDLWLGLLIADITFDMGDWAASREWLPAGDRPQHGTTEFNLLIRRAELALGVGDLDATHAYVARMDELVRDSREPQFIGVAGALKGELLRREGDLEGAREAVEAALDRIEFCSEDVMRIARVATVGVKVAADAAQQARDLGDAAGAEDAAAQATLLTERVHAAAAGDRPVEHAYALSADAEHQRALGVNDPDLWRRAADAWQALGRRYLSAQVLLRLAEAQAGAGDRERAAATVAEARELAGRLGSTWLLTELDGLSARARLRPAAGVPAEAPEPESDGDDPFGLTPRERQVLSLVAAGRTNREIGTSLFMAEKTASVHVSRILSKLDVRSRTEAAAVAHRLGLDAATPRSPAGTGVGDVAS